MRGILLAISMLLAQADPASVVQFPMLDSGSMQCGAQQVTWNSMRSFDLNVQGSAELQALAPDGTLVADLSKPLQAGEALAPLWCGDLLGDGTQVLAVQAFSGGAHCCFSISLVQLVDGAPHLLDADFGNGGLSLPQQLDDSGSLELIGGSDVFAYFDDLSFAASPFMPLVYAYDGQQYVEATRQFPGYIQAEIGRASAALGPAVARPIAQNVPPQLRYQEQESIALKLYGLHVLLGDADAALPKIQAQVAPPVAQWLTANAAAAQAAMAQVYTLDGKSSPTGGSKGAEPPFNPAQ